MNIIWCSTYERFTLEARFSTNEIIEFLKSVAAVSGRLVTSVILSLPSGHMALSTGLELDKEKVKRKDQHLQDYWAKREAAEFNIRPC